MITRLYEDNVCIAQWVLLSGWSEHSSPTEFILSKGKLYRYYRMDNIGRIKGWFICKGLWFKGELLWSKEAQGDEIIIVLGDSIEEHVI